MLIMPSFKKTLIVERFQENYIKHLIVFYVIDIHNTFPASHTQRPLFPTIFRQWGGNPYVRDSIFNAYYRYATKIARFTADK